MDAGSKSVVISKQSTLEGAKTTNDTVNHSQSSLEISEAKKKRARDVASPEVIKERKASNRKKKNAKEEIFKNIYMPTTMNLKNQAKKQKPSEPRRSTANDRPKLIDPVLGERKVTDLEGLSPDDILVRNNLDLEEKKSEKQETAAVAPS